MLKKIFGKKKEAKIEKTSNCSIIAHKISTMNLTEITNYMDNKIVNFEPDIIGLEEIMKKFITPVANTKKLCLRIDDMDTKKKKCFVLVLKIIEHRDTNIKILKMIQKFCFVYEELIKKFDYDYSSKYQAKFEETIENRLRNIGELTEDELSK